MTVFHDSAVDRPALRAYRLERVREQLRQRDYAGILLYDPLNIRYATDTSNMQVWTMHNKVRYAFIPTEGPVVLFDFHNCEHLSADIEVIDEIRPATAYFYFEAGQRSEELAGRWADEIAELLRLHGGGNRRLAVDKVDPHGNRALAERQIEILDGEEVMELARVIKAEVEVQAMMEAIEACEEGMRRMQAALRPGITENALWSILHQCNIELGGEWIETRLLTSGPRTFPWFQECSNRVIEAGDMVSFDTDLVGPNGYCADISRSWLCGDGPPSPEQRELYAIGHAQLHYNLGLIKPGLAFREFAEIAYQLPPECIGHRYSCLAHGIGLCDEYPAIPYLEDFDRIGYDGTIREGMTLCVESLVGRDGGRESVKLEQQILVTADGHRPLSSYPFETVLLP
ncbi:MAG: Xaa-Pro peptidase family protein [Alphaproteobacteria bacterium]|nr:Xaa-Pro peptidase family protein [Alphaproteobacteria bacterium]MDP6811590.1 Xaa-Pro peptidase family protein [Alphaproteobacteria bacterium]